MSFAKRIARSVLVVGVAFTWTAVVLPLTSRAQGGPSEDPFEAAQAAIANLPAPYSTWDVQVTAQAGEAGTFVLTYDSPALQRRAASTLYVPAVYSASGSRCPVMYFLHGTIVPLVDAVGGTAQILLEDFPSQRNTAQFVVVAVDVDVSPEGHLPNWCQTCAWINGNDDVLPNVPPLTAEPVPAETVLYDEIVPLVERVLNVRTDRAGRGVMGFSMGALGTLIQGFRHPDKYAYVAAISGVYDIVDEPVANNFVTTMGYLRDQGYGTKQTHPVWWRNFNPRDLVGNFVGSGAQLMLSAGDQCLLPTDPEGAADCAAYPPLLNPGPVAIETMIRNNVDLSIGQIAAAGVMAQQIRFSGVHGANNHRVYAQVIVPTANQIFAAGVLAPQMFSYRTADSLFRIWGYDVSVDRDCPEFLSLEAASQTGTPFSLRGSGDVTLLTPPEFVPGRAYVVSYSSATREVSRQTLTAGPDRRLQLHVDLDHSAFATGNSLITGLLGEEAPAYARVSIAPVHP